MKIHSFDTEEDWLNFRIGKIGGSRLKDVVTKTKGKKIAFYELIAERLGVPAEDETPIAHGKRLEPEAIERFEKESGKTVDKSLVIWTRDDNESISCSPDGFMGDTEAVEVKCLTSARHIQSIIENKIPDDYQLQVTQYFIVNEKLQTLYFVLYDPRIVARPYVLFEVHRSSIEEDIANYHSYQEQLLREVAEWVAKLSDF